MRSGPITIPGVVGSVTVDSSFWSGRQSVFVGDQPAASTGKRRFALPTADGGTAEGSVTRSSLVNPFPTVQVGGVKHPTGPEVPVALRILLVVPILLVAFGGLVGAVLAVASIALNYTLVRSTRPTATKAMLMTLVVGVAFAVWITVAALIAR